MKVDEAISIIELSNSFSELKAGLQRIAEGYGFASYNFMDSGSPDKLTPYYFGTTGDWEAV